MNEQRTNFDIYQIPTLEQINSLDFTQLSQALFSIDHKLKIAQSHFDSASKNSDEISKNQFKTEMQKLEGLKDKIKSKLQLLRP